MPPRLAYATRSLTPIGANAARTHPRTRDHKPSRRKRRPRVPIQNVPDEFVMPHTPTATTPTTYRRQCHSVLTPFLRHVHESLVQKAIQQAARQAGLTKRVTSHTFRHSFARHLLADGYDIRTVQELLGHKDVRTTMIYTHTVPSRTQKERASPLDLGNRTAPV